MGWSTLLAAMILFVQIFSDLVFQPTREHLLLCFRTLTVGQYQPIGVGIGRDHGSAKKLIYKWQGSH